MAIFAKLSFSLRASTEFAFFPNEPPSGLSNEPARVEMVLKLSRQDIGQVTDLVHGVVRAMAVTLLAGQLNRGGGE
jgi:hypothetical protein